MPRRFAHGLIAILVAVSGLPRPLFAQNDPVPPPQPDQESMKPGAQPPMKGAPPGPRNDPGRSLEDRNRRIAAQREEAMRRVQEGRPAQFDRTNPPVGVEAGELGVPPGAEEHLEGEGDLRLDFGAEAVDIAAIIDYVARVLKVNITADPAIMQQQVALRAPIEIPKDKLLPLLSKIVSDKGFVLVEDPLLGYFIQSAAAAGVNFEGGDLATTRVIRTPLVRPSSLQQPLTAALGASAQSVRMTPFDDLGILIVTGPAPMLDNVEAFVNRILDEVADQTLRHFQLQNVEAGYARSRVLILNGHLGGGGGGGGGPGVPQVPNAAAGGALANLDSRLIVDTGNRLIFRGSEDELVQIAELIRMVDSVPKLISRRYSAGSVAMDVANAGEREGLGPISQGGGGSSPSQGLGLFGRNQGGAIPGQGAASAGAEAQPNTSGFTIDTESGSIIYSGTESQHARVAELVRTFTEQIVGSRVDIKTYKLHNAKAESIAELLNQLIEDPSQQTGTSPFLPTSRVAAARQNRVPLIPGEVAPVDDAGGAGGESAGNALGGADVEISIVADTERNQLLVKAPARQQAELEQIIRHLDERQPQVYIEAQIVSVVTSDDFNFTVETQINSGQFLLFSSFGLSTAGTAVAGQQAAQGTRIVGTGNRGLTSAVIKSDYVPIIINALQTETNARIESRPRILVNDNQTGRISSQREEPFATTTQGTATTTTGQGGTAQAGTTLDVTPRISQGGYISLEYSIELSSFVGSSVAGLQPPTQRENYDSQVTIPSDSTIVVGGFTLISDGENEAGIPLLKDIPLIGFLFKSYGSSKRRTTIFVFITPTIMTDPNFIDLRLVSEGPMAHMGVQGVTPRLEPVIIPIDGSSLFKSRRIPVNQAPAGP